MGNWLSSSLKSFNPIAAGIDFVTDNVSYAIQSAQNYNYQRKLQQHQFDWQEKMWHMNNEYNSPINQVKRLDEGGLNPNLAYGSLTGNLAQQPSGGTPGFSGGKGHQGHASQTYAAKVQEALGLSQLEQKKKVDDSIISQHNAAAEESKQRARLFEEQALGQEIQNQVDYNYKMQDAGYESFRRKWESREQEQRYKNAVKEYDYIVAKISTEESLQGYYDASSKNQLAMASKSYAEAEFIRTQNKYYPELVGSQISSNYAESFSKFVDGVVKIVKTPHEIKKITMEINKLASDIILDIEQAKKIEGEREGDNTGDWIKYVIPTIIGLLPYGRIFKGLKWVATLGKVKPKLPNNGYIGPAGPPPPPKGFTGSKQDWVNLYNKVKSKLGVNGKQ